MTTEERVRSLHRKMEDLRHRREKRKTCAIGATGAVLTACLLLLIFGEGAAYGGSPANSYSGTMMLFENVGGYVLVGVISFTAAVIITVISIQWKKKQKEKMMQDEADRDPRREEKDDEE